MRSRGGREVQLDRAQHEGHHQRLDVARRQIAQPVRAGEERQRREHPGDRPARACREPKASVRAARPATRTTASQRLGAAGAGERQRGGEQHRQRLPAGMGDGAEAEARAWRAPCRRPARPRGRRTGRREAPARPPRGPRIQRTAPPGREARLGSQRTSGADRRRHCRLGCTPSAAGASRRNGQAHGAEPRTSTAWPGAQAAMSWASVARRRRRTGQRGEPEDRRDGEQQTAVGDDGHRRIGGIHAVEHERADQAAVDARRSRPGSGMRLPSCPTR
jgi:hypothetical protein